MERLFITRKIDTNSGRVLLEEQFETALAAIMHSEDQNHACLMVGLTGDTWAYLLETTEVDHLEVPLTGGGNWAVY